jgi:flagellar basal body P-ring formation protein FlgA
MTFLITVALLAAPAHAGAFQSTTALDAMVEQFAGAAIGAVGGARAPVDARLKLAACADPQLAWRDPATEDAVVIRCAAPQWRLFVPVNALPKAARPVSVAAAPIVKAQPVIKRGDPVMVEAGSPGFSITRDGIAVGEAVPGGRLLIKVDDRKPPIQAIALESGRARLPGFGE